MDDPRQVLYVLCKYINMFASTPTPGSTSPPPLRFLSLMRRIRLKYDILAVEWIHLPLEWGSVVLKVTPTRDLPGLLGCLVGAIIWIALKQYQWSTTHFRLFNTIAFAKYDYASFKKIPGPPLDPIFGNARLLNVPPTERLSVLRSMLCEPSWWHKIPMSKLS